MTILFFGSSAYSVIVLQALLKAGYQPTVITTPPKPSGRSRQPTPNPLHQFSQAQSLTLHLANQIPSTSVDLIISADYGLKIPQAVLNLAKINALNIHPSLLPKYRGAAPVPHALLAGEAQTGITIIQMTDKIDAGPIIAQQTIPISPQDNAETLLTKCFKLGSILLIKTLPGYIEHKITPKPQPTKSPTAYSRRFTKQDGFVPWTNLKSALSTNGQQLNNKIRALHPWPGVYTLMPNHKTLKLLSARLERDKLLPTSVQLAGKQPISWQQFLAGYKHLVK
jgi:methionyl-tRNA formyltransferase